MKITNPTQNDLKILSEMQPHSCTQPQTLNEWFDHHITQAATKQALGRAFKRLQKGGLVDFCEKEKVWFVKS